MNDRRKTKAQLIDELKELRLRLQTLEQAARSDGQATGHNVNNYYHPLSTSLPPQLANHGVWIVDTDFVIRVANEAMCRLLHKPAEQVVGRKCYDLMSGPNCHSEQCAMRTAFARLDSVHVDEMRKPFGRVPLACRVVAHLVHDRSDEATGIVEYIEDIEPSREAGAKPSKGFGRPSSRPTSLPAIRQLAQTALDVASSLRSHMPEDELAAQAAAKLEAACTPFQPGSFKTNSENDRPMLWEVPCQRSVLIVAPPRSKIRGSWSEVVKRAGYSTHVAGDNEPQRTNAPSVAILDLALGEPVTDDLHNRLRQNHPAIPILVVSSAQNDALEARRWRRPQTWYVPRSIDGDELVRLIEDVTPRPALRSRSER